MDFYLEIDERQIRQEGRKPAHCGNRLVEKQNRQRNLPLLWNPSPPKELTLDHIVPVARGGRSTRNNCVPACKECNNRKKNLLPLEWDDYLRQRDKL